MNNLSLTGINGEFNRPVTLHPHTLLFTQVKRLHNIFDVCDRRILKQFLIELRHYTVLEFAFIGKQKWVELYFRAGSVCVSNLLNSQATWGHFLYFIWNRAFQVYRHVFAHQRLFDALFAFLLFRAAYFLDLDAVVEVFERNSLFEIFPLAQALLKKIKEHLVLWLVLAVFILVQNLFIKSVKIAVWVFDEILCLESCLVSWDEHICLVSHK